MKIGFEMMLWTTHVTPEHYPIVEDIKKTGYDGIGVPVFEGTPDDYARLGRHLDSIGMSRTSLGVLGPPDADPLSADPAKRKGAVAHLTWMLDCAQALGADVLVGPLHSVFGQVSGAPRTETERARGRDFHREVGDLAAKRGVRLALEALNRFECYFSNTMDDLGAYVDYVGHPNIKALYDSFHANIEEDDPVGAFTRNARHVIHVHISENHRGVPGRGHVPWAATFKAVRASGYDGWLSIESFGRFLPGLAAATKIWRDLSAAPEDVYREGYKTIRQGWAAAKPKAGAARPKRTQATSHRRPSKSPVNKRPARTAASPTRRDKQP